MRKKATLITGAVGEIGQALIVALSKSEERDSLLTLDLKPLPQKLGELVTHIEGDILDETLLTRLVTEYEIDVVYHLAALLSTRAEFAPEMAHQVNVNGTMLMLRLTAEQSERSGRSVRFIFPSSIAAYGMPDLAVKAQNTNVREWEWNYPTTMYGCNKLYCELVGTYYGQYYQQMAAKRPQLVDFRSLRFPGLFSAYTLPSGGTSDYAPEMLHAAAKAEPYDCFVREDTRIPFMAMPDAVEAILQLARAPLSALRHRVYNVRAFSLSAEEVRELVLRAYPEAQIAFKPDEKRQNIVDSWPADVNDGAARRDWGWQPNYDADRAFSEYLVPIISKRYRN